MPKYCCMKIGVLLVLKPYSDFRLMAEFLLNLVAEYQGSHISLIFHSKQCCLILQTDYSSVNHCICQSFSGDFIMVNIL